MKRFLRAVARTIGRLRRPAGNGGVTAAAAPVKVTSAKRAVPRKATPAKPAPRKAIPTKAAPRKATSAKRAAPRKATSAKRTAPRKATPTKAAPRKVKAVGRERVAYDPLLDGDADPGEVVWTWVAYEDDPSQGKDRPVVIVGRDGDAVLGLMLSSQADRDGDRHWIALGAGAWDRQDRPSWVRLDRVLRIPSDGIRREGAVLDRARFDRVAAALRRQYGWR